MENERRRHMRRDARLPAQIRISLYMTDVTASVRNTSRQIYGMVDTVNIARGGFRLQVVGTTMDIGKGITPPMLNGLKGKSVVVEFDSPKMTAWADVVRVMPENMQLGLRINRVSDEEIWSDLCDAEVDTPDDGLSLD